MAMPDEIKEISGSAGLHDWFGYWPDFHDAEIISLHLNRKGTSSLCVHTWDTTKEVDEKGQYVMAKHVVVEFIFENVSDLTLNDSVSRMLFPNLTLRKSVQVSG